MSRLYLVVVLALSCISAAGANAQPQADIRNSVMVGPNVSHDPNLFLRLTYWGKKGLVDVIGLGDSDFQYTEIDLGAWARNRGGEYIAPITGVSLDSDKNVNGFAGMQYYKFMKRISIVIPVLRYEFPIDGTSSSAFAFIANPAVRPVWKNYLSKTALAAEYQLYAPLDGNASWSVGIAPRFVPNAQQSYELGVFRNQDGEHSVRLRIILTGG